MHHDARIRCFICFDATRYYKVVKTDKKKDGKARTLQRLYIHAVVGVIVELAIEMNLCSALHRGRSKTSSDIEVVA